MKEMGVGDYIPFKSLTAEKLTKALLGALEDPTVALRAKSVGERIRSENGVLAAIGAFHKYLDSAKIRPQSDSVDLGDTTSSNILSPGVLSDAEGDESVDMKIAIPGTTTPPITAALATIAPTTPTASSIIPVTTSSSTIPETTSSTIL